MVKRCGTGPEDVLRHLDAGPTLLAHQVAIAAPSQLIEGTPLPKVHTAIHAETFESVQTAIGGGQVGVERAQVYLVVGPDLWLPAA